MTPTQGEHAQTALAHELFAAAQLAPGEGIEDAVSRIAAALTAPQGVAYAELAEPVYQWTDGTRTLHQDVVSAIRDYAGSKPEEGESWESWFEAAFDLLGVRVGEIFDEHALRASNGQAPAGAASEVPGKEAWRVACPFCGGEHTGRTFHKGSQVIECQNCLARGPQADDADAAKLAWATRAPTPTAQAAPATGAVAGMPPGIGALMCVISSLRDTAHFSDEEGELTDELRTLRDWAMTQAAAPTPAAQADSVLEDAARWQFVELAPSAITLRLHNLRPDQREQYVDAARKQGAKHDNH
jgi:hypothetical protein